MNVAALKAFCRRLPAARERLLEAPYNILAYSVGERNFAWFKTSEPERWRFSFRTSAERFLELTDMPGVKPARYLARHRWVTVVDVATFPADYLRELVRWSHAQAAAGLTRRRRAELGLVSVVADSEASRR